jgi:hypothetical protein
VSAGKKPKSEQPPPATSKQQTGIISDRSIYSKIWKTCSNNHDWLFAGEDDASSSFQCYMNLPLN